MSNFKFLNTPDITILTGPVKTGKTTFLMDVFKNRKDSGGFLTPDINGKRQFFRLDTKEYQPFDLENPTQEDQVIAIGPYQFDKRIFDLGNQLITHFHHTSFSFFIVDEVGKLELKGDGFDLSLKNLFSSQQQSTNKKIILIIRDYLVEDVIKRYHIQADVINIGEKKKFLDKFHLTDKG